MQSINGDGGRDGRVGAVEHVEVDQAGLQSVRAEDITVESALAVHGRGERILHNGLDVAEDVEVGKVGFGKGSADVQRKVGAFSVVSALKASRATVGFEADAAKFGHKSAQLRAKSNASGDSLDVSLKAAKQVKVADTALAKERAYGRLVTALWQACWKRIRAVGGE